MKALFFLCAQVLISSTYAAESVKLFELALTHVCRCESYQGILIYDNIDGSVVWEPAGKTHRICSEIIDLGNFLNSEIKIRSPISVLDLENKYISMRLPNPKNSRSNGGFFDAILDVEDSLLGILKKIKMVCTWRPKILIKIVKDN